MEAVRSLAFANSSEQLRRWTDDKRRGRSAWSGTNTGRIVVGSDGSAAAMEAVHWAARQAELTSSTLEIITTWDWPPSYGWAMPFPADFDPENGVQR